MIPPSGDVWVMLLDERRNVLGSQRIVGYWKDGFFYSRDKHTKFSLPRGTVVREIVLSGDGWAIRGCKGEWPALGGGVFLTWQGAVVGPAGVIEARP